MNPLHPDFSESNLQQGLIQGEEATLQLIYKDIRPGVLRALQPLGASDGSAYFLAALTDAAALIRSGQYPIGTPLHAVLEQLALRHFADTQSDEPSDDTTAAEPPPYWMPDSDTLKATRAHLYAWRALDGLPGNCAQTLMGNRFESDATCRQALAQALKAPEASELPEWAAAALERKDDYAVWKKMRQYEQNLEKGLTIDGQEPPPSKSALVVRAAFGIMGVLTLGFMVYAWFTRPKDASAIFQENFQPPQSLLADIAKKMENDSSDLERPERCQELLTVADGFYADKNYSAAKGPLFAILDEPELEACYSDASFALGLIALKQEEPGEAIQYFSKIQNIEAYGEDLYWYQALSFVQLAKTNANVRPVAQRAVQRFLENTRNEERRKQAETMLNDLK